MIPNNIIAYVFARGGSKGIPKKNLKKLGGIPLIGRAIQSGLSSSYISEVVVSTDCEEIAEVAKQYGASVPFVRPNDLAGDSSPELLAWRHAINYFEDFYSKNKNTVFVSLPATSPLRIAADIDKAIEYYYRNNFDLVLAVSESRRNPYLNMVKIAENGNISVVNKDNDFVRRQDVPKVYDISTSVYVAKPEYLLNCKKIMSDNTGAIEIPSDRTIDIDDNYDFHLAELLLKNPYTEALS